MSALKTNKWFLRDESGVSAVEFALILVPLLLLILGTVEFGRAIQIRNEIERSLDIASRDFEIREYERFQNCSGIRTYFETELKTGSRSAIVPNSDNISVSIRCTTSVDNHIEVTAYYSFTLLIPFLDFNIIDLPIVRLVQWPSPS